MSADHDEPPDRSVDVQSLPRSIDPDPALENRIVAALQARGLLRRNAIRRRRWVAVGAAAALFLAGLAVGSWARPTPSATVARRPPTFALLLYGEPSGEARGSGETQRVEDYRGWAMGLKGAGRYVSGERLDDRARQVGRFGSSDVEPVRGFFIVSAGSLDEAEALARTCPHALRGGWIVVRPIDPT